MEKEYRVIDLISDYKRKFLRKFKRKVTRGKRRRLKIRKKSKKLHILKKLFILLITLTLIGSGIFMV